MSERLITKIKLSILPLDFLTNLAAAFAVPPVAIKSSIIITFSFFLIESLCISIVALPYSSSKSSEYFLAGNLFFFLINISGLDNL